MTGHTNVYETKLFLVKCPIKGLTVGKANDIVNNIKAMFPDESTVFEGKYQYKFVFVPDKSIDSISIVNISSLEEIDIKGIIKNVEKIKEPVKKVVSGKNTPTKQDQIKKDSVKLTNTGNKQWVRMYTSKRVAEENKKWYDPWYDPYGVTCDAWFSVIEKLNKK